MVATRIPNISEQDLRSICEKHGVSELSLFGSRARGDFKDNSDYDILVEFDPTKSIGYLEFFALRRELSELIKRKVDLISKRGLKPRVRDFVLSESKIIYAA